MILIDYYSNGGYKLFDPMNRQIVISRDVFVDELKDFDWRNSSKKDSSENHV